MTTSKTFFKNNLENLESTSEFSRVLVTFTHSSLDSAASLLQHHRFKSICFSVTFILGLFVNFFLAINFIKLENKNLKRYKISISEQKYKKIMLQFYYFNHEDQEANKNWNNYEDFYQILMIIMRTRLFIFF